MEALFCNHLSDRFLYSVKDLIPIESEKTCRFVKLAREQSQEPTFFSSHCKSSTYLLLASSCSILNTFLYSARTLASSAIYLIDHGKAAAMSALKNDAKHTLQSLLGTVALVITAALTFFNPAFISSSEFRLEFEDFAQEETCTPMQIAQEKIETLETKVQQLENSIQNSSQSFSTEKEYLKKQVEELTLQINNDQETNRKLKLRNVFLQSKLKGYDSSKQRLAITQTQLKDANKIITEQNKMLDGLLVAIKKIQPKTHSLTRSKSVSYF